MWGQFVIAAKLTVIRFLKEKSLTVVAAKGCLQKAALELEWAIGYLRIIVQHMSDDSWLIAESKVKRKC